MTEEQLQFPPQEQPVEEPFTQPDLLDQTANPDELYIQWLEIVSQLSAPQIKGIRDAVGPISRGTDFALLKQGVAMGRGMLAQ